MSITNIVLALQIITTNISHTAGGFAVSYEVMGVVPSARPAKGISVNSDVISVSVANHFGGIKNAPDLIPLGAFYVDDLGGYRFDHQCVGVLFRKRLEESDRNRNERATVMRIFDTTNKNK